MGSNPIRSTIYGPSIGAGRATTGGSTPLTSTTYGLLPSPASRLFPPVRLPYSVSGVHSQAASALVSSLRVPVFGMRRG